MNKKGFTLIELIITIGVMVLVGLVIVTNMTGLFSKNEDADYENFRKKIENAACIYAEKKEWEENKNKCKNHVVGANCVITTTTLIKAGLLEESLKDPNTGHYVKDNSKYDVTVSWASDGEKKCTLKE
ncbi:MAG: type II secretion system protein [Bacilli bacterium]|jgi:prepilin-type N-terminal cleavage/methylation domain-containing protein|nr:type II secretion system protein [Bacilli bacterium]